VRANAKTVTAHLTLVIDYHTRPAFNGELKRDKQAATFRRPIAGHIVHMPSMKTVRAMITDLRPAPRDKLRAVHALKFFIAMNGIAPHLCRFGTPQQCLHQPLAVEITCIADAPHSSKFNCNGSQLGIAVDLPAEGFHLSARADLLQSFLQQLGVHVR
jgi:hypothetical protein